MSMYPPLKEGDEGFGAIAPIAAMPAMSAPGAAKGKGKGSSKDVAPLPSVPEPPPAPATATAPPPTPPAAAAPAAAAPAPGRKVNPLFSREADSDEEFLEPGSAVEGAPLPAAPPAIAPLADPPAVVPAPVVAPMAAPAAVVPVSVAPAVAPAPLNAPAKGKGKGNGKGGAPLPPVPAPLPAGMDTSKGKGKDKGKDKGKGGGKDKGKDKGKGGDASPPATAPPPAIGNGGAGKGPVAVTGIGKGKGSTPSPGPPLSVANAPVPAVPGDDNSNTWESEDGVLGEEPVAAWKYKSPSVPAAPSTSALPPPAPAEAGAVNLDRDRAPAMNVPAEEARRVDRFDGNAYSLAEFQQCYGPAASEHWDSAQPAGVQGTAAAETPVPTAAESAYVQQQPEPPQPEMSEMPLTSLIATATPPPTPPTPQTYNLQQRFSPGRPKSPLMSSIRSSSDKRTEHLRIQLQELVASFDFATDTRGGAPKVRRMQELRLQIAQAETQSVEPEPRLSPRSIQASTHAMAQMYETMAASSQVLQSPVSPAATIRRLESQVADAERRASENTRILANQDQLLAVASAEADAGEMGSRLPIAVDDASASASSRDASAQYIQMERQEADAANAAAAGHLVRRTNLEDQVDEAMVELSQTKAKLSEAEVALARLEAQLESREQLLVERTEIASRVTAAMHEKVAAVKTDLSDVLDSRATQAADAAQESLRRVEEQAKIQVAKERHARENMEAKLTHESDARRAADKRVEQITAALKQTEVLLAQAEHKAQQNFEELARKDELLARSNESLRTVKLEADRLVLDAQMHAREEAESRGKAAAEAAMSVAADAAKRASDVVEVEKVAKEEAMVRIRTEVQLREAAELKAEESAESLARLEHALADADEALARTRNDAQTAITAAANAAAKVETEKLSYVDRIRAESGARQAAERRAAETATSLAKTQSLLKAQAEALSLAQADNDKAVKDVTMNAAQRVAATVELKRRAAADAAARLRQEAAARDRAEKYAAETGEALAKTEAMLAASTDALQKAREETRWSRLSSMTEAVSGYGDEESFRDVSTSRQDSSATLSRMQERRRMRMSSRPNVGGTRGLYRNIV